MADTTTTTMTGSINTSLIAKAMLSYAIDEPVALGYLRMEPIAGLGGTKTAAFQVATKSTSVAATSEDSLTPAALTTANTTVAVSEVGILRRISKLAARTNVFGEPGTYQFAADDGAKLCVEKMETDAWAQWTNASTSVGTSGAAMTIADAANAVSQLAINKARGDVVFLLTATQVKNLRAAFAATTAVVFTGAQSLLAKARDDGYCGTLFGIDVWVSNLGTASGSNTPGVIMVDGNRYPQNASTGVALGWMPEMETGYATDLSGRDVLVTAAYGLGEISDFNYVKVLTVT